MILNDIVIGKKYWLIRGDEMLRAKVIAKENDTVHWRCGRLFGMNYPAESFIAPVKPWWQFWK